eukprot:6926484-Alexandrium_andersonii.AAC.1
MKAMKAVMQFLHLQQQHYSRLQQPGGPQPGHSGLPQFGSGACAPNVPPDPALPQTPTATSSMALASSTCGPTGATTSSEVPQQQKNKRRWGGARPASSPRR